MKCRSQPSFLIMQARRNSDFVTSEISELLSSGRIREVSNNDVHTINPLSVADNGDKLTLIGLGFFDIFRFGGRRMLSPLIIFVVCSLIATKFCTGIDNQSISSDMEKKLYKIYDVIGNDFVIVRKLAEKTVTVT